MSRAVSKRGRMLADDEHRIQMNTLFIEQEVDGGDLAPSLYAATVIDANDKDEVLSGRTRLERTRRLLDIILLRGHDAFGGFLNSLEGAGYDHVAFRIRNTEAAAASRNSIADLELQARRLSHTSTGFVAYGKSIKVSYSQESLPELVRSCTVPDNVFLTSSLDSGTSTQMKDMMAQPRDKLQRRDSEVSKRGSTTSLTSNDSEQEVTAARVKGRTPSDSDKGSKSIDERLKRIEDAWFILSRRITRVEDRATRTTEVPEEELHIIKEELADLKTDTLQQVYDLTMENERKDAIIQSLTMEVEERRAKLAEAQEKIESLEKRIADLESEKGRAEADVRLLKEKLETQEKRVEEQHNHFSTETLRLRNQVLTQGKQIKEQEATLEELQQKEQLNTQRFWEQEEELRDQRLQMADQIQQLSLLTQFVHGMAQTGMSGPPPPPAANPTFCISGNNVNSNRNSTARSVKRSAAPPIYRGFKRK